MQNFSTRNIEQLITNPFKDPRWQSRLGLAFLSILAGTIIPVLPWLVSLGYLAQIIRLAANTPGLPEHLPDWDDFGQIVSDGLRLLGIVIIFFLPSLLLFFGAYAAMFGGMIIDSGGFGRFLVDEAAPPLLSILGFFVMFGASMAFTLLVSFFTPAVITHVAVTRRFSAAFQFGEWWRIFRANWAAFVIALVLVIGLSYALAFIYQLLMLTIVLLCLLPFVIAAISTYLMVVSGTLFGAAYREALQSLHPAVTPVSDTPAAPEVKLEPPADPEMI